MTELHVGAAILREAMQTAEKEEDEGLKVRTAKAEEELRKKRVCAFSFTVDISSSGNSICFVFVLGEGSVFGRPQDADAPRGAREIHPAPATRGKKLSSVTHDAVSRMLKACSVFCSCWAADGHQSVYVPSPGTRIQLPAMSIKMWT